MQTQAARGMTEVYLFPLLPLLIKQPYSADKFLNKVPDKAFTLHCRDV